MEDYTRFRLKSEDELIPLLKQKDNLFVIACNKCFKEFNSVSEPECGQFEKIAREQGRAITGCMHVDFPCNKPMTQKKLASALPPGTENVAVISCGLGVQTIGELVELPVYAASDSLRRKDGKHGMALTDLRCGACGQCYLNLTGGICPIVDCSKSLVNGQCGGSKDLKCEVSKDKDCAWDKIHERLSAQNRVADAVGAPVELRDYSKVGFKFINDYVKSVREKRYEGFYGGIHPSELKELTEHMALKEFPAPQIAVIPLSQHAGAPATVLVGVGDTVKVGQKIGDSAGFISSTIHSSVSGVVKAIEERPHSTTGMSVLSVIIESDGKNELHESVLPYANWESLSVDEIADIVREKGIVGMGGAGFPTSVKLKSPKPVDTVLINGCECEPLLTVDHRVLLENADDVIFGLKVMLKTTGAATGIIVIEDNKHDAIELLQAKTADIGNIQIVVAKTKYPQGAEKMLIKRTLGRAVPSGALPLDVGVVVSNVSTVKAVSDAIQKGMPLIERPVSVTGPLMKNPGNFLVKIGTPISQLIEHCGGVTDSDAMIKLGGPMMGFKPPNFDVPIIKGTNGIIAIEPDVSEAVSCIKCGRCADVCPMELLPLYYPKYKDEQNWQGAKDKNILDCMECGCCEYICSSKIKIRDAIKLGKKFVREMGGK